MQISQKKRISWTVIGLLLLIGVSAYVLFVHDSAGEKPVMIGAVGDIMVHTGQLSDAWDPETETFDFSPSFEKVAPLLEQQDLMMGNLETTCAGLGAIQTEVLIHGYSGFPLFNTPDAIAAALHQSGFDLISVVNNHALDAGQQGLVRTISVLEDSGLTVVSDINCVYQNVEGLQVAVLAAAYGTNGHPAPEGFPTLQDGDPERFEALLMRVRDVQDQADIVTVMLHDGEEYSSEPSQELIDRADRLIAAGCDLVLVSHAHVPGPVAIRTVQDAQGQERQGLVLYGLGNCISAQEYTQELPVHVERAMIASIEVSRKGRIEGLRLYPTCVTRGTAGYQVELLRDEDGRVWFEQTILGSLEYTYQTAEGCFYIDLREKEE